MQANKTFHYTYYGPFDLDDLRQIVEETKDLPGDTGVEPGVIPKDRPYESDSTKITIGKYL